MPRDQDIPLTSSVLLHSKPLLCSFDFSTSTGFSRTMAPLTLFLTTWNAGLQGSKAQTQDLTGWLLPVLHQTARDPEVPEGIIPDLYAIAVQELLPVHLARESCPRRSS
jgi:hypothetical protein